MSDFRDIQHGVNDPVGGLDVKRQINDNRTSHEQAQHHADVRADATATPNRSYRNGCAGKPLIRSIRAPAGDRRISLRNIRL